VPTTLDAKQVHLTTSSLHTVNGEHYDAEAMILHRARIPGMEGAVDEVVMLSVFFQIDDTKSSPLFSQMGFGTDGKVPHETSPTWLPPGSNGDGVVNLKEELETALEGDVFFYNGSVPVPPCSETVKWFIVKDPLPVSSGQVESLRAMLRTWTAGGALSYRAHNKRQPVPRNNRKIVKNTLKIGGDHHEESCKSFTKAQQARSALCWSSIAPTCSLSSHSQSPLPVKKSAAVKENSPTSKLSEHLFYKTPPAGSKVIVQPSLYSLDMMPADHSHMTEGNMFGHLAAHGRIFPVRKISIKAIANHLIEGERHAAELVVEHTMFGDPLWDAKKYPTYKPDQHTVMLSVPIKLGSENQLLRQMGLGASAFEQTIRDMHSYEPIEDVDLETGLAPAMAGDWFWYNGSETQPDCRESVKWLVLATPIEASLEQINYLALSVPGVDATRMPTWERPHSVDPDVYYNHLPAHAVQIDKQCFVHSEGGWNYENTHCWDKCTYGCHEMCTTGQSQSPIDIRSADIGGEKKDNFLHICRWRPVSRLHVANSGHAFTVANQQMGYIEQLGEDGFATFYQVIQFHLHMPSEHMIDGKQYHAELQVVHAKQHAVDELDRTKLLIASVFFEIGDTESALINQLLFPSRETFAAPEPHEFQMSDYPIDLMRALGPVIDRPFYTYTGSLTTPPCLEGVKWMVFETPQSMTTDQWVFFKEFYANPANNRPTQPINERKVAKNAFAFVGEDPVEADFDFHLTRHIGRDRREPGAAWIVVPIVGTVLLCVGVMVSLFVREDVRRTKESAGGLAETIGNAYRQVG